jgi:cytochrome c6
LIGWRRLVSCLVALLLLLGLILPPPALSEPDGPDPGASLFQAHCAGCHLQGGNIIRRSKTLRLAALERNGVASEEAIAAIAAGGLGQMGGYAASLGDGGPEAVAAWVWRQALDGWPRT